MTNKLTAANLNPLSSVNLDMSSVLQIFVVIGIAVLILGLIGFLVWLTISKKKWFIRIPLSKKVGGKYNKIGTLKAKVIPMGRAGDVLWFVKGKGIKKWIAPAEMQDAPNSYPHYIREDGEWVNYEFPDIDEEMKKAKVKYVKTDMRLQRLATDKLLEQRHKKVSFMEKWGVAIGFTIFFLIIAVSLVVFFHQYSKVVDNLGSVMSKADQILTKSNKVAGNSGSAELIPAFIPCLWFVIRNKRRKTWKKI